MNIAYDTAEPEARTSSMRVWEPVAIFVTTLILLTIAAPRIITFLSPVTGDEPFYLMTAQSIIADGDLNECNNYRQRDERLFYPAFYGESLGFVTRPLGWQGWPGVPYPLPPHPAVLVPASRMCVSTDPSVPLPASGGNELYSKHGLGLSLLVLPAFVAGGREVVVFFLNILAALLALNVYFLARESVARAFPAVLTWVAFTFTVPLFAYSFLIFPELPAALLVLYAFRRIRLGGNKLWQVALIGFCIAFLPWLHYRFIPVSAGLFLYYVYRELALRQAARRDEAVTPATSGWAHFTVVWQSVISGALLMLFFYHRYRQVTPNIADHAGISDVAGTLRGAAGLLLDEQWGLLVAAPTFVLVIVGVLLMAKERSGRSDLLWLGIICVPYYGVIANYAQWWGEWCPPARYLTSILPLLALPFAISLEYVRGFIYKSFYAVLLLLSLLTTWGFLAQPQWLYNHPTGVNNLFTYAVPELLYRLPFSLPAFEISNRISQAVPSFVMPYFRYIQSPEAGDAAAAAAWSESLWLVVGIAVVVGISLFLARRSRSRESGTASGVAEQVGQPASS